MNIIREKNNDDNIYNAKVSTFEGILEYNNNIDPNKEGISPFVSLSTKKYEEKENTQKLVDSSQEHLPFPQQLMQILFRKEFEDIISWMPEGKSFLIRQKNRLHEVLRLCNLKESKFDSFRRKLHRWGFRVAQKGAKDAGAYYHKYFVRDLPSLCLNMKFNATKTKARTEEYNKQNKNLTITSRDISTAIILQDNLHRTIPTRINKQQLRSNFKSYVEMKHDDFWSKRKHLLDKYSVSRVNSPFNHCNIPIIQDLFNDISTTYHINACNAKRGCLAEEKCNKLALKKKIKHRMEHEKIEKHLTHNLNRFHCSNNAHAA